MLSSNMVKCTTNNDAASDEHAVIEHGATLFMENEYTTSDEDVCHSHGFYIAAALGMRLHTCVQRTHSLLP